MKKTTGYSRVIGNLVYFNFSQVSGDTRLLKLLSVDETHTRTIKYYILCSIGGLIFTSNRISRLFLSGRAGGGIEKMRSIFFQKTKSSGVPVIPPNGGTGSEAKA